MGVAEVWDSLFSDSHARGSWAWVPSLELTYTIIASVYFMLAGDDWVRHRGIGLFTHQSADLSIGLFAALAASLSYFRNKAFAPGRMQVFYAVELERVAVSQIAGVPTLAISSLLFVWPMLRLLVVGAWGVGWMLWFEKSKRVKATFTR